MRAYLKRKKVDFVLALDFIEKIVTESNQNFYSIEKRIKNFDSLIEKMERKNLPLTISGLDKIDDIAGLRVIVNSVSEVYDLVHYFKMSNLEILKMDDYIKNPKESGYRSFHLVLNVNNTKVEVQIRTVAMDKFSVIEHALRYKKDSVSDSDNLYLERLLQRTLKEDGLDNF